MRILSDGLKSKGNDLSHNNEYLRDAQRLTRMMSAMTKREMTDDETIQCALLFAIGMEKLLKHILIEINPVFVLEKPDFGHAVQTLYKNKIVAATKHKELVEKPDRGVIALRVALSRAQAISQAVLNNKNILFTVASWRDVIVHRPCSELDLVAVSKMLTQDAARVVAEICMHHTYSLSEFLGESEKRLIQLGKELTQQAKVDDKMQALLAKHKAFWKTRVSNAGDVAEAELATELLLDKDGDDFAHDKVNCPACGNEGVVRVEPDYDRADGESYIAGVYAEYLHCYFCGLELSTYEELNYINIDALLAANYG